MDNIDQMTGKDLGIAVAREVMGWKEWPGDEDYEGSYPMFCDWGEDWGLTIYEDDETGDFARHWAPWDDMNDCMEVEAKLAEMGYELLLRRHLNIWHGWAASLLLCPNSPYATGSSPNEAILRVALKAVRGGE